MNQGSIKSWPCILLSVTRAVSEGSDISFPFLFFLSIIPIVTVRDLAHIGTSKDKPSMVSATNVTGNNNIVHELRPDDENLR